MAEELPSDFLMGALGWAASTSKEMRVRHPPRVFNYVGGGVTAVVCSWRMCVRACVRTNTHTRAHTHTQTHTRADTPCGTHARDKNAKEQRNMDITRRLCFNLRLQHLKILLLHR
jgi:hypothetical protein